ncbi:hypothetical protein GOODEAATRI_012205 [Goodea atripinnis]|uniref:Uncharacterized protein n=1 Tax=Goodea atripinnis TaxID=208336 RepID=A0ABV0P3G5_9TELE
MLQLNRRTATLICFHVRSLPCFCPHDRSLPLRPSPVSACSPDCRRVAAPGLGCKLLITDGCDMTPVGDAITEAFAREKRAIQFRVCQQTLRSTRLIHGGHI